MADKLSTRILLLDDEPFILKLLARMLANLGYTAVSAYENGFAALAQLDHPDGPPELILMDINMPEMDGVEFLHQLVERGFAGGVILVSGEDERVVRATEALVRAHKIHLLGRLSKPVTPAALAALLDQWPALPDDQTEPLQRMQHGADAIRRAITHGELVNYYQPKVAVRTGRVVGVEALVRWRHPDQGLLLPEQFMAETTEHGLIGGLSREVLVAAVTQAADWHESGRLLQISVNLSAQDLESAELADILANLVGEAGISAQGIQLEVAQRLLQHNSPMLLETLTRLRLKRFRLAIDDFGSVSMPPGQLRSIPCDEFKLSADLLHSTRLDGPGAELFRHCIEQARQLDAQVLGKGVETLDDWDMLRRTGCDLAQGYFIGKPMPADELPGWLSHWHRRISSGFRSSPLQPGH